VISVMVSTLVLTGKESTWKQRFGDAIAGALLV
jgi:hypothetical protein